MPARSAALAYGLATLIGLAAILATITPPAAIGRGPGWWLPSIDTAQAIAGHLAYQYDAWRWPLLDARTLFWPRGVSIALTDSNPLVSLAAKIWTHATGDGPVDLQAPFWTFCWLMQPVAAAYAARGLGLRLAPTLAAAAIATFWPAQLFRLDHLNLCAHFEILLALGLVFRHRARPLGWIAPAALLLLAVLTHPYIFAIVFGVLAIVPLDAILSRRPGRWREVVRFGVATVIPLAVLTVLSGPLGGGDKGFVFFSMNLLSPFWPQRSGVFSRLLGTTLPIIDATGGQYEGYNWIGAGTLLLLIAGLVTVRRVRPWAALIAVMGGLTLLSLSSRIYAGHLLVLDLGTKPWEDIFAAFRAPARAFWPVGYAIMLFAVAWVARLRPAFAMPLFAAAVALQIIDTAPLRAEITQVRDQGEAWVVPAIPAATQLVSVSPYSGCNEGGALRAQSNMLLLHAAYGGMKLGSIGLGRPPTWFSCERMRADAEELPLLPGELRAYFGTEPAIRTALLGADAICVPADAAILCGRGLALAGTPMPRTGGAAPVTPGTAIAGAGLIRYVGAGWHQGVGAVWSEGPYSTLLIGLPDAADATVTLDLTGIAFTAGGTRRIEIDADRTRVASLDLPDGQATTAAFKVPAAAMPDGVLRLAFSTIRPVDPKRRNIAAPVNRAAIMLTGVTVR